MLTTATVTSKIKAYIQSHGGRYSAWYVGIAANPKNRLFSEHRVDQHRDAWIFSDAGSEAAARLIEKHFIALGCRGGDGGGSIATRYVYAFRMN